MNKLDNLSLIIPVKQESESLPKMLNEIRTMKCKKYAIMEINDLKSINSIKNFDCELIVQKSKGYGMAIIEGLNFVKTKYCCIINADGSMNPNLIKKMMNKCANNDFIFASRYTSKGGSEDDNILTFIGNKIFTFLGNILFKLNLSDILYTFILGKTKSFQKLNLKSKDFRLCVEIPIKIKINKMRYISLGDYERARIAGKKKVRAFRDGFLILTEMLKLYFNKK
jgi:glycosyltransferase involved in cell wall biosynthesis